jgi:hypothetical protein
MAVHRQIADHRELLPAMWIVERLASRSAPAADPSPQRDRLRVITAGRVGSIEARLATSGFDVVAIAENEEDLLLAVSAGEPDAVVVDADLCTSLERVRELAPDAIVIAVGDHTPPGAVGRIQGGVSGTVMAGLLHALVTEGLGAAVILGFLPALRSPAPVRFPQHLAGSLAWVKAELLRAVESALPGQPALAAAAGTVAVTVSASLLLMAGHPGVHERPSSVRTQAVERALPRPVVDPAATRGTPSRHLQVERRDAGTRRARVSHASTGRGHWGHRRPDHPASLGRPMTHAPNDGSRAAAETSPMGDRPPEHAPPPDTAKTEAATGFRASDGREPQRDTGHTRKQRETSGPGVSG